MTEQELQSLIDLMRRNGVSSLKAMGVEIHLDARREEIDAPTPATNPRFDLPPVDSKPLTGDDGLTVEQQIELYGRPLDSFDPKKREE